MSSKEKSPEELVVEEFNRLRGKVAGLIESWGLFEKQERAAISTFKSLTYDSEKVLKELLSSS